jgi:outer membrane protein assembly factor BamB
MRPIIAAAMMLFACAAACAGEAEWNRFRGPDGLGISAATTIPVKWTEKDYNWKVALPGVGHSSPVLWGQKIFLTAGDPKTARRTVLCLSAADGRTLWQRDYESMAYSQSADNSFATATPAVDADGVYVTWTAPKEVTLLGLDHNGGEKWRRNLGPFVGEHGSGTSPIVYDDMVVLSNDQDGKSFLVAVDRKTGQTRWQVERRSVTFGVAYPTPCVCRPNGGPPRLIFTSTAHGITAVDPATGKVDWEMGDAVRGRCVASPIWVDGLILASFGYGDPGIGFVAVRPPSAEQGGKPKIVYDRRKAAPCVPTPLAKDGRVYLWADDGRVACLKTLTGEQVWFEKVGATFYGSPVWVDGRLYAIAKNGDVVVIAAADKFEVLARVPLGEASFSTPAVSGGVMYLRTQSHLFSLGGKKP